MKFFILAVIMLGIVVLNQAKPHGGGSGYSGGGGGFVHNDEIGYGSVPGAVGSRCATSGCPIGSVGQGYGVFENRRNDGYVPVSSITIIGGPFGGFPDSNYDIGIDGYAGAGAHGIKGHSGPENPGTPIFSISPATPVGQGGYSTISNQNQGFTDQGESSYVGSGAHGIKGHSRPANSGIPTFPTSPGTLVGQGGYSGLTDHGETHTNRNRNYGSPAHSGLTNRRPPVFYDHEHGSRSHSHPPGYYDRDQGISDHRPFHTIGPDGGLNNPSRGLSPGIFDANHLQGGYHGLKDSAHHNRGYAGSHYGRRYDEEYDNPRGHIGGSGFYPYGGAYPSKDHIKGHGY